MKHPPRLSALFNYGQTSCFFAMHSELFASSKPHWRAKLCGGEAMPCWDRASVGVQFHSYSKSFFLQAVLPVLPELRRKYKRANGVLSTPCPRGMNT